MNTAEQEFAHVAAQLTTDELLELRDLVELGDIDGGNYIKGECGCFYGSIALIRHELDEARWQDVPAYRNKLLGDKAEAFLSDGDFTVLEDDICHIPLGDIPEYNTWSAWLHDLITDEIARRQP